MLKTKQFAAEILSYVITMNKEDMEARKLKASAYRSWSARQQNVYWRNLALNVAAELEGTRDFGDNLAFASVDVITGLPTEKVMDMMTSTIDAEKSEKS